MCFLAAEPGHVMRICKDCGATEDSVPWVTNHGKHEGLCCMHCKGKRSWKYHSKNLEAHRASNNAWRSANYEAETIRTKAWYLANQDIVKAKSRIYKLAHPGIRAKYRAAKLKRAVSWANQKAIKVIYANALKMTTETGIKHHVDHIIPLQGKLVSGLHVENNLQVVTAKENLIKGRKFSV